MAHGLTQAEIDRQVSEAVKAGTPLYGVDGELLRVLQPDLIVTQAVCDVCAVSPSDIHSALGGVPADVLSGATIVALSGTSFAGVLDEWLASSVYVHFVRCSHCVFLLIISS